MFSSGPAHRLEAEEVGGVTVVRILERHIRDDAVVRSIRHDLGRLIKQVGRPRLLLDFSQVEHMSSTMIGTLLHAMQDARAEGGRLAVCCLRPELAEALSLTGVDRVVPTYPGQQQGLASF